MDGDGDSDFCLCVGKGTECVESQGRRENFTETNGTILFICLIVGLGTQHGSALLSTVEAMVCDYEPVIIPKLKMDPSCTLRRIRGRDGLRISIFSTRSFHISREL